MEPKREFTIKLRFGAQNRNPSNDEVFNFFRKHEWDCDDLSAMYREDFSVFVRFQKELVMNQAIAKLGPNTSFEYANGTVIQVSVTAANGTFKYVRLFGLLPEVEDRHIVSVMSKYGSVQQLVRERYPAESGFPIWNGIRGVHMEVTAEIPAQLQIQHVKARVYYEGMQNKCFGCGAQDHFKASCPKRQSVNARLNTVAGNPNQGKQVAAASYANIVTHGNMEPAASTSGMVILSKGGNVDQASDSSVEAVEQLVQDKEVNAVTDNNPMEVDVNKEKQLAKKEGKKRSRVAKNKNSETSDTEAVGGKQFIVPAVKVDLFLAQKLRSRSLNSRGKSGELQTSTTKQGE